MGLFNLGNMIGAFSGTPKYDAIDLPYNKDVNEQLKSLLATLGVDTGTDTGIFDTLRAKNEALSPEYATASKSGANLLQALANNGADPYGGYERLRSGNLDALDKWKNNLFDYGSRYDKLAGARTGMGGSPGSSYMSILNQDRAGKNLSPVLSQIFGSLGRDTAALEGSSLQDRAFRSQLPGQALQLLAGANELPLREQAARQKSRSLGAMLLAALGDIARGNEARGVQRRKTGLDRWSQFGQAADEGLNSALNIITSLYSGGLLGGMGGGSPAATPASQQHTF